ncbi:TetR/AcrR family transcriptional regulator [Rhodobacteraceae bacterium LMO-12]|nr:TetR/AcrR family transcriptional regulator [Rhodobacteraceae bacterium LMO-JJ12]
MENTRLSPESWIDAGILALEKNGPLALKAEPLARELGATKGSFYWHFKDLGEFHSDLAQTWKRRAASTLVGVLESDAPIAESLQAVGSPAQAEAAMRAWARSNPAAAAELSEIDKLRLAATAALLQDVGISNPEIPRGLYACAVGLATLAEDDPTKDHAVLSTLIDLVLALR